MGTNCGISEPDELARLNWHANDLGIDTIETGAMMGVLMEAGLAKFGDIEFLNNVISQIKKGLKLENYGRSTGAVGKHYKVDRVPVIKNQGISVRSSSN